MKQEEHDEIMKSVREQLALKDQQLAEKEAGFHEELARLRGLLRDQGTVDLVEGERNTLRQKLVEQQQELDRVRSVLRDAVNGVQNWVPDLTPIGNPPPTLPREHHAAWVATEVDRRRREWDVFVERVVSQGTV